MSRTPELGTSVIRWTRYDGTPKTLPKQKIYIILLLKKTGLNCIGFLDMGGNWIIVGEEILDPEIGDIWAYLPEPPEAMQ